VTPLWRRPIWLLGHVVALAAVVAFARLGLWQLDRLEEKRDRNRLIAERADGPAIDIAEVDIERAEFQHTRATGRFDTGDQVLIRNRSYRGTLGANVVTPLVLRGSSAVLVNRGWIPLDTEPPDPPDGEVTVEGLLLASQQRGIGPRDPADGRLAVLNRVDVRRIDAQSELDLFPLHLSLARPEPEGDYPIPLDPPVRDEGPHRSYAIQWFLFTGIVLIGYPILLRRRIAAG
jgi:cytochrome oxidase assembly protein ShyY1